MGYTFGVDYYPEHWPRERWQTDARMMREMGITIVRMAEFSWAKWEPREGEFHFEELDEVIALMANEGIDCILGTPSAAPPAWIIEETPEIQPLDSHLQRHYFGGRHHDCQSNAQYRAHIRRFVTAYARHFAANPHVVGWQVDNELGNSHEDLCYCPSCEAAFRQWLQKKYGSIDCLNESWGTAFWSQTYTDFEQIHAPRITAAGKNPSQQLDWMRFCSDLVLDFHQMQADILRSETPDKFITHNMMGFSRKVDYFKLGDQLDFTAQDQYPGGHFVPQGVFRGDIQAAELDFIRSLKHRPFWVMEQQSAITGWETVGRTPKPGQLGLWAMQSIAHGADTIVFFRWRSCVMGTEQYWHGILPHNGRPGRYYRELKAFMQEAGPLLERLQGSVPHPEVAMLFCTRMIQQKQVLDPILFPHSRFHSFRSLRKPVQRGLLRKLLHKAICKCGGHFGADIIDGALSNLLFAYSGRTGIKFAVIGGQDFSICHFQNIAPLFAGIDIVTPANDALGIQQTVVFRHPNAAQIIQHGRQLLLREGKVGCVLHTAAHVQNQHAALLHIRMEFFRQLFCHQELQGRDKHSVG